MLQLFISYDHADVTWAEALHKRLKDDGIKCFFDKASIRAGDDWDDRIRNDVMTSEHMLVLWSKEAKDSDWVRRETGLFDALITMGNNNQNGKKRKLIYLLLDIDERSHSRYQQITHLRHSGAYPGDVKNVDPAIWNQVINEVEAAVSDDTDSIPVSLAVLALTSARFDALYSQNINGFATSVNSALSSIGIDSSEPSAFNSFKQRYGNRAGDWRPFNGLENVSQILERVRLEFNKCIDEEGKQFQWIPIGEKFYEGTNIEASDELQQIRNTKKDQLACFVIDPLSLFDSSVVDKLNVLDNIFDDENTIILVLTPFVLNHQILLMDWIREKATAFFDRQHYTSIRRRYAHCAMNIGAERDIGRVFRAAMGPHIYPQLKPIRDVDVYTRHSR